jgi:protease-4
MSDAAASGGYYMAMTGDTIVAYPGTQTGSIGVVFGKPNLHGLYDKVGVSKDSVSRGRFALIESDYEPLTEAGRQKLREGIDASYEDFLGKVAAARKKKVSDIEPVAQGRVWLGDQAKANGLVDELGGIDRALELVKKKAGLDARRHAAHDALFDRTEIAAIELKQQQSLVIRLVSALCLLRPGSVRHIGSGTSETDVKRTQAGFSLFRRTWRRHRVRARTVHE